MPVCPADNLLGAARLGHRPLQRLQDIPLQVLGVLDAAADAHQVVKDAGGLALVGRDAGVGHAGGELDQALDAAEALGEGEEAGELAEAAGGGVAAAEAEGQHAAAHAGAVLAEGDGAVGVGVQAGVVDGEDGGVGLEGAGDGGGVGGGLAGAQVQRLEAPVGEPAVEGGGDGADGVLQEGEAGAEVVAVEGGDAHDHVRVAVDVLCDGVHDDVGAVVQGVLDVGAQEGVVDDDQDAAGVGGGGDGADVDQAEGGVGRGLDPDEAGVVGHVRGQVGLDVRGEGDADAVGAGDLGEVAVGAAVDVRDGDDVGPGGEALQDVGGGGAARGEGEGVLGVLEGGDGGLEVGPVGVAGPAVLVLAHGLADGGLGVGGGEGDGLDDGAGHRVVRRAGVHGEGAEACGGGEVAWRGRDGLVTAIGLTVGVAIGVAIGDRDCHGMVWYDVVWYGLVGRVKTD